MKVTQFYNKNQFIINDGNGNIYFQSYDSTIARIDASGNLTLGLDWDYSNTTRKHFYMFLTEYRYKIKHEQREAIFTRLFFEGGNKRKHLQKLIDNKIIKINL